eukprot:TRINITY_DN701_c0_g2_i3.p1 TRINITY_DN701_c0_g2~~TRINITY_DN701_c0_g2_i3.p1  ORF type:complete len:1541 (+),score=406.72 TRINITY_DN701_c0_g2_i3:53-4675(+)
MGGKHPRGSEMANQDSAALLRSIDKIVFEPFMSDPMTCLKRCEAALQRGATRVGTIYKKDGQTTLLITALSGNQVIVETEINIEGIDVNLLTDNVNQCDIFKNVDSFTEKLAPQLLKAGINPSEFNIKLQDSGTRFSTTSTSGQVVVAAFSFLTPTYFDLCCQYKGKDLVYYSSTRAGPLRHSGDVVSQNRLLHTLSLSGSDCGSEITPFITGYSGTPLRRFEEHRPVVVVVDHTTKELVVVRVPLDQATLGDNTLCAPLVGRLGDRGIIYWEVLTNACVGTGSVPSLTAASRASLERARNSTPDLASFERSIHQANNHSDPVPQSKFDTSALPVDTEETKDIDEGEVICDKTLLVNSLDVKESTINAILSVGGTSVKNNFTNRLQFGTSAIMCTPDGCIDSKYHPAEATMPSGDVILPCVTDGPFEGGVVLAAGTVTPVLKDPDSGKPFTRNKIFKQSSTIVSIVGSKLTDAAREANPYARINGLFIVVSNSDNSNVKDHLLQLNINAATALAGPRSLILAYLTRSNKFFTMDGIGIPGLLQGPIEPLKDCTEEFTSNFASWVQGEKEANAYSGVVDIRTAKVLFMEEEHTKESLISLFDSVTVQDLVDNKSDVMDALGQLRRIYDNNDLKEFALKLIPTIREKMVPKFRLTEEESSRLDELFSGQMKKTDTYMKATREKNKNKKALMWFVDALGALVSTKRSGTVGFSIQNLAKQQKVQANIKTALSLSRDDFAELVSENCNDVGSIIMNIDKRKLVEGLKHVKAETLITSNPPFTFDGEVGKLNTTQSRVLDATSTLSLMDLTESWNDHPLSSIPGSDAITLGVPISKELPDQSAVTFFLPDKLVEIQDPFTTSWYSLADWQPVAVLRVLMRGTVANCCEGRNLGKLEPASKHIGYLLIHLYLQQIRQLAKVQSDEELDFDNPNCQIQRALFGCLLCLMSSGTGEPLCSAFHLMGKEKVPAIPKEDDWPIYAEVAKYFKYTAWPSYQLKYNTAWLLVHWLNVKLAACVMDAVRGETKGGKDLVTGQVIQKRGKILLLGKPPADKQPKMATRNRQRVVAIWGADVVSINKQLNGQPQTKEEQIRGGYWLDKKHNMTFLSCPKAIYQSNMNKVLPFADASIITFGPETAIDLDKYALASLLLSAKGLMVTYSHGNNPDPEIETQIRDLLTIRLKKYNRFKNIDQIPIIHKSLLTTDVVDSTFESLKTIEYNENEPLRGATYRGFKVKGVGYVFAVKIESGSIFVGQELSFSKSKIKGWTGKNEVQGQTTCKVRSIRKFPGTESTEALAGDFVAIAVTLGEKNPLRGAVVTDITKTTFKTVDKIEILAQKVSPQPWIKVGANLVCYSAGSLCTLVVDDIKEATNANTRILVCSTLYNGLNATFESDNMNLCKVTLITGSLHYMAGKVLGIPGATKVETVEVTKTAEAVVPAAHAKVVLPPSFSNQILGLVLQQIVTKEVILNLIEDRVFTEKHAGRVSKAIAGCKPPPVSVLKTLCCDSGLDMDPDSIAKVMLQFLEELMNSGCSETTEHKILQRLLGSQ